MTVYSSEKRDFIHRLLTFLSANVHIFKRAETSLNTNM